MEDHPSSHELASASPNGVHQSIASLSSDDLHQEHPLGLLTVFQANPIAYTDDRGEVHPMTLLDMDSERQRLTESLKAAVGDSIEIDFRIATTELLSRFLSRGEGHILHFSCHGHAEYLAIEDDWGHTQVLRNSMLKKWFQLGGESLRFVFVGACNSRTAGDAFIEAGVPHVVCCRSDKDEVNNAVAIEFEKVFYTSLACGKPLQQAFDLAQHEVPLLLQCVIDASTESRKFVLLPDKANHDVPISFERKPFSKCQPNRALGTAIIPLAPEPFIGRELDMFRVIDALKLSRLVRVSGRFGIGKRALVKTCCHYISYRNYMFQDIFWFPWKHEEKNVVCQSFRRLISSFHGKSYDSATAESPFNKIIEHFRNRKALLVFDAKRMVRSENGMRNFNAFLDDLFEATRNVKVIVVVYPDHHISTKTAREREIEISALTLPSTSALFGRMCDHVIMHTHPAVRTPQEFAELLAPNKQRDPYGRLSNRVYTLLGKGIPGMVLGLARNMPPELFKQLIDISQSADAGSRVALEIRSKSLAEDYKSAVQEDDIARAEEIQQVLDRIELLRQEYPELSKLKEMAETTSGEYKTALSAGRFEQAQQLRTRLTRLHEMIEAEKKVARAFGEEASETGVKTGDSDDSSPRFAANLPGGRKRCSEHVDEKDLVLVERKEKVGKRNDSFVGDKDSDDFNTEPPEAAGDSTERHSNVVPLQHQFSFAEGTEGYFVAMTSSDVSPTFPLIAAMETDEDKQVDEEDSMVVSVEALTSSSKHSQVAPDYPELSIRDRMMKPSKTLPRDRVLDQQGTTQENSDAPKPVNGVAHAESTIVGNDLANPGQDETKNEYKSETVGENHRRYQWERSQSEDSIPSLINSSHASSQSERKSSSVGSVESENLSVSSFATLERRASLARSIRKHEWELQNAASFCDFDRAERIDRKISHLKRCKERLLDCAKLKDKLCKLTTELDEAKEMRNWNECRVLHDRMERVAKEIRKFGYVSESSTVATAATHDARADLSKMIRDLDQEVWHAATICDFEKAEQMDREIERLNREKARLLVREKLQGEQCELTTKLDEAVEARNWIECKRIKKRIEEVERMLKEKSTSEVDPPSADSPTVKYSSLTVASKAKHPSEPVAFSNSGSDENMEMNRLAHNRDIFVPLLPNLAEELDSVDQWRCNSARQGLIGTDTAKASARFEASQTHSAHFEEGFQMDSLERIYEMNRRQNYQPGPSTVGRRSCPAPEASFSSPDDETLVSESTSPSTESAQHSVQATSVLNLFNESLDPRDLSSTSEADGFRRQLVDSIQQHSGEVCDRFQVYTSRSGVSQPSSQSTFTAPKESESSANRDPSSKDPDKTALDGKDRPGKHKELCLAPSIEPGSNVPPRENAARTETQTGYRQSMDNIPPCPIRERPGAIRVPGISGTTYDYADNLEPLPGGQGIDELVRTMVQQALTEAIPTTAAPVEAVAVPRLPPLVIAEPVRRRNWLRRLRKLFRRNKQR